MAAKSRLILFQAMSCLSFGVTPSDTSLGGEKDLKPEEVVAGRLKSIGDPMIVQSIKTRSISGTASAVFIRGKYPSVPDGESLIISAGCRLGILMKFKALGYYGEYLAFDCDSVSVGNVDTLQIQN